MKIQGIGNMSAMSGDRGRRNNAPAQYKTRQKQYLSDASSAFAQVYGKYATDFVKARMQGLVPGDFYKWINTNIRIADTIKQGISLTRQTDSQKEFYIADRTINYVSEGAKVEAMGSTWLVTNPANVSSDKANGIMRRCNATWNHFDFYGNLLKEPILIEKSQASATANDFQGAGPMLIMQGYFNIIAQLNEQTKELDQNSRLILGRRAYQITGYSDVTREFTMDENSGHAFYFVARMQEPNYEIDDMDLSVAGGKTFSWVISIDGNPAMLAGDTAQFTAHSRRNGDEVESTEENPITYLWSSNAPEVADVDPETGLVTAISEGEATITATLKENPVHTATFTVNVQAKETVKDEFRFTTKPPKTMEAYDVETLTAAFYRGGKRDTEALVSWAFTGAKEGSYTAEDDGKGTATIRCWGASETPLTVTASCEGQEIQAKIELEGI